MLSRKKVDNLAIYIPPFYLSSCLKHIHPNRHRQIVFICQNISNAISPSFFSFWRNFGFYTLKRPTCHSKRVAKYLQNIVPCLSLRDIYRIFAEHCSLRVTWSKRVAECFSVLFTFSWLRFHPVQALPVTPLMQPGSTNVKIQIELLFPYSRQIRAKQKFQSITLKRSIIPSLVYISVSFPRNTNKVFFSWWLCVFSGRSEEQTVVFIVLDNGSVCWVLVSEVCYVKAGAMCCLMPLTLMLPSVIVLLVFTGPDQDPATGHFLWAHLSWAMIKTQPLVNFYEHTCPEQWSGNENAQKYDVVCNRTE